MKLKKIFDEVIKKVHMKIFMNFFYLSYETELFL